MLPLNWKTRLVWESVTVIWPLPTRCWAMLKKQPINTKRYIKSCGGSGWPAANYCLVFSLYLNAVHIKAMYIVHY